MMPCLSAMTMNMNFISSGRGSNSIRVRSPTFYSIRQYGIDAISCLYTNRSDRIIHYVGHGMHGNVASAIDIRDNSIVAIKISRGTHDERQGAEAEVAMLKNLRDKVSDTV